jgi:TusE/DsrC/DsvC family sulfur relay protein
MMEVMKHVGRAATKVKAHRDASPTALRREKLAAMLGPRRAQAAAVRAPRRAPDATKPTAARAPTPAAASAPAAASSVDGVALGADGHLIDPKQWTESLATKIAATLGIELDEPRRALVRFARAEFEAKGTSPNIRRITQGAQVATKDVYALFPKAPGRAIAKIAGIPKPIGCI